MRSNRDAVKYTVNMQCPLIMELTRLVMQLRSSGYVGVSKSLLIKASAYYMAQQAKVGDIKKVEAIVSEYLNSDISTNTIIKRDKNVL